MGIATGGHQSRAVMLLSLAISLSLPGSLALPDDVPETFYPFGEEEGDQIAPVNDDGSTELIPIVTEFPFFHHLQDSLFVNTNGVLSFLMAVGQFTPDPFPLDGDRRLVAPFWTDVDTRINHGRIYYRQATDNEILARATQDIRDTFINQPHFQATWVFLSTWHQVTYYGGHSNTSVNSFQAVLITNGRHSFTIFNYGDIMWTTGRASGGDQDGLGGTPAQAGFNAGDGLRYFNIPGSRQPEIVDVETTSNVGQPGRWVFRIDAADIEGGGCNTGGRLTVQPRFGSPLGGQLVTVAGPCLEPNDTITCLFNDEVEAPGQVVDSIRASCVSPLMLTRGRIPLAIAVNGGNYTHTGIYILADETPEVTMTPSDTWRAGESPLTIQWEESVFTSSAVDVDLVAFQIVDGVKVSQVIPMLTGVPNNGQHQIPARLLNQTSFWVENGALRVRQAGISQNIHAECVWSEMHVPEWYIGLYIYELALERLPGRGPRPDRDETIWDKSNKVWDSIWDLFRGVHNDFEDAVTERFEEVRNSLFGGWCEAWYNSEVSDPPALDVPACPCDTNQLQLETADFEPDDACNMGNGCRYHPGAFHCVRSRTASPSGAGQQCCYSEPTNGQPGSILPFRLGNGQLAGGTYDRAHVKGHFRLWPPVLKVPYVSHFREDVLPFHHCCEWSNNCDKYSEMRYTDDCSDYIPPRPGGGWGDPHIVTLDGMGYTFNGLGEYCLLRVEGGFSLQGRTQQAVNESGNPSPASMWTAFAIASLDVPSDTVQVQTNELQPLEVLINGQVEEFEDLPEQEFVGVDVAMNTTNVHISFANGVYVKVTSVEDSLQFLIVVPETYKGQTQGLLGTFNDDPGDDFLMPNGTTLSPNSSLEELHTFGQLWQTSGNDSLFTYALGESHEAFQDPDFRPTVDFDSVDPERLDNARSLCGGDLECIFDYVTTGRETFALASKEAKAEHLTMVENSREVVTCGFLVTPTHGSQVADNYFSGSTVTFSCDEGYEMQGSEARTCYDDGTWSGVEASCVLLDTGDGDGEGGDGEGLTTLAYIGIGIGAAILVVVVVGVAYTIKGRGKKIHQTA